LRDEVGAKIWVDTTIKVKHLNLFQIDETYPERFPDYPEADVIEVGGWNDRRRKREREWGFGGWSLEKACYEKIRELLPDGGTILELGSGSVTKKLARHYTVYSIEEDAERVNGSGLIFHAPISGGWYEAEAVKRAIPEHYDLILVDGPVTNAEVSRVGFVDNLDLFNTDVPIVFDDVNRPDDDWAMRLVAKITGRTPEIHRGHQKDFGVLA
jgi:hypothetical protein